MLRRSNFIVLRFRHDSKLPKLFVKLLHKLFDARLQRSEIMILQLLCFGRSRAEQRSPCINEILSLQEKLFIN